MLADVDPRRTRSTPRRSRQDHATDARDPSCPSLRPAGRPDRAEPPIAEDRGLLRRRGLRAVPRRALGRSPARVIRSRGGVQLLPYEEPRRTGRCGRGRHRTIPSRTSARLLRNYGERGRFEHVLHGLNSRLDALQAAVLQAKLGHLETGNDRRRHLAKRYDELLEGTPLVTPVTADGAEHVFHLYVVQADRRDVFRTALDAAGIGTAVQYPTPVHRQPAYRGLDVPGGFPWRNGSPSES